MSEGPRRGRVARGRRRVVALRPCRLAVLRFRGFPAYCAAGSHGALPVPEGPLTYHIMRAVVQHSKIFGSTSARGHNPNCRPAGLCRLRPAADIAVEMLTAGLCHEPTYAMQQTDLQSITRSERASSVGEMSSPIALAVLRLITNSNFVGCSIGRSAGLAPLNILSTKIAALRKTSGKSGP